MADKLTQPMVDALVGAVYYPGDGYQLDEVKTVTRKALEARGLTEGGWLTPEGIDARVANGGEVQVETESAGTVAVVQDEVFLSDAAKAVLVLSDDEEPLAVWEAELLGLVTSHPFEPNIIVTVGEAKALVDEDLKTARVLPNRATRRGWRKLRVQTARIVTKMRDKRASKRAKTRVNVIARKIKQGDRVETPFGPLLVNNAETNGTTTFLDGTTGTDPVSFHTPSNTILRLV